MRNNQIQFLYKTGYKCVKNSFELDMRIVSCGIYKTSSCYLSISRLPPVHFVLPYRCNRVHNGNVHTFSLSREHLLSHSGQGYSISTHFNRSHHTCLVKLSKQSKGCYYENKRFRSSSADITNDDLANNSEIKEGQYQSALYIRHMDQFNTSTIYADLNLESRLKDMDHLKANLAARGLDLDVEDLVQRFFIYLTILHCITLHISS